MTVTLETLLLQIELNNELLKSKLDKAGDSVESFSSKSKKALTAIGVSFSTAFTAAVINNIALAADEMVRLEARLNVTTGSANKAAEAMSFLQKTAARQSIDLLDLGNAYTRLLPAVQSGVLSLDEMRRILTLANDNIKALGLGSDEARGLFLGLSQALGSGTVTMEDLKQVTDRLSGSLESIAKANGMAVNEFKKLVATGTVTADMIKGSLITAFEKNEGAAEKMAGTLESSSIKMQNSIRNLSKSIGDAGLSEGMVNLKTNIANAADGFASFVKVLDNYFSKLEEGRQRNREFIQSLQEIKKLNTLGLDSPEQKEEVLRHINTKYPSTIATEAMAKSPATTPAPVMRPKLLETDTDKKLREKKAEEAERERQDLEKQLLVFQQSLMTKSELENSNYEARLEQLQAFKDAKLLSEEEQRTLEIETMLEHESELTRIKEEAEKARADIINNSQGALLSSFADFNKVLLNQDRITGIARVGVLTNAFATMLAQAGQHNKQMFELNKVAGIANALVATYQGAANALKTLPFPLNIAAAGAVTAAGLAQVQSIRSQSFGGGGGTGGGVGGAGASPSASATQEASGGGSERGVNISIAGISSSAMFSGQQVRELIGAINDEIGNGAVIRGVSVG